METYRRIHAQDWEDWEPDGQRGHSLPSDAYYLVMVNVGVSCDDYSLLNPRLRNASFHSLKEAEELC